MKGVLFKRPESMTSTPMHYCTGCGHGIIHRLICEVIDELGIRERVIAVAPVGCAVIAYDYWDFDVSEAAHGRTPAVATGIKRVHPDKIVFTYQGDGDLAAIGTAEVIHAANRGENITVIFVNNGVYGMTGGQMAPTTVIGQRTATTKKGRDPRRDGMPLKISEMISILDGVRYVERTSLHNPTYVLRTKKAIKNAFEVQLHNSGFSMVEVISMCPTYWNISTVESCRYIEEVIMRTYPPGILKNEQ